MVLFIERKLFLYVSSITAQSYELKKENSSRKKLLSAQKDVIFKEPWKIGDLPRLDHDKQVPQARIITQYYRETSCNTD